MTRQNSIVVVVSRWRNFDVLQRHPQVEASVAASNIRPKPEAFLDFWLGAGGISRGTLILYDMIALLK